MNNKFNKFAVLGLFGMTFCAGCVVPGAYTYDTYGTTTYTTGTTTYTTGGTVYATPAYHTEVTYVETMAPSRLYVNAGHGRHHKPDAVTYRHTPPRKAPTTHKAPAPRNTPKAQSGHRPAAAPKPAAAHKPRNAPKANNAPKAKAPAKPAHASSPKAHGNRPGPPPKTRAPKPAKI